MTISNVKMTKKQQRKNEHFIEAEKYGTVVSTAKPINRTKKSPQFPGGVLFQSSEVTEFIEKLFPIKILRQDY